MIGIIYGALCCLAQTDMKRLIAFSSVAHMGFVMLGIATLTDFGINAAIFGMVAHGLITGMLFFLAGSVQHTYDTREMSRLGGLLDPGAATWAGSSGSRAMASLGPPRARRASGASSRSILSALQPGAVGLSGPTTCSAIYMVVAAIGTVLAAGYLLWMFQRVAFGTPKDGVRSTPTSTTSTGFEWVAWTPLLRPDRRPRRLPDSSLFNEVTD